VSENGREVAEEMVRQACLWQELTNRGKVPSSQAWWKYKLEWMQQCKGDHLSGGSSEACSEKVRRGRARVRLLCARRPCICELPDLRKSGCRAAAPAVAHSTIQVCALPLRRSRFTARSATDATQHAH
jgi:hypothetical protein